jgi:hypothetical protein
MACFDSFSDAEAFIFAHLCKEEEVYSLEVPTYSKVYSINEKDSDNWIPYDKR